MLYEERLIQALEIIQPTIKFILSDRNRPEPAAPYCLVSVLNLSKNGQSSKAVVSTTNAELMQQEMQVVYRLTLHALATDAIQDTYETMHIGLDSSYYISQFYEKGLGILNVSEITYTSAPVDTVIYKRASIDITCLCNRIDEFFADRISEVNVEGTVTDTENTEKQFDVNVISP